MSQRTAVNLVNLQHIPAQSGWESPLIHASRFKQGGIQWSLTNNTAGVVTGVVNPETARIYGTMYSERTIKATPGSRRANYTYDSTRVASVAGNPQLWVPLTWVAFGALPTGVLGTGVAEITNTRGYNFLRIVWDITAPLSSFSLATSFLGD
jgi:hypothetical protein